MTRASLPGLRDMLKSQGNRCALTGRKLTPQNSTIDHIVPISDGGTGEMENLQIVTKLANTAKYTSCMKDFIQMCKDVAKYHGRAK